MNVCARLVNWKVITCGLPRGRQVVNDRAPTIEEIQKLVKYPDRRIKLIVSTIISSGIRIGACNYLRWKHVLPLTNDIDELTPANLLVYAGDQEEYYTFITPKAYNLLREW
jgi:integrase